MRGNLVRVEVHGQAAPRSVLFAIARRRRSALEVFLADRLPRVHVEAPVVNRALAGGGPLVLDEEHEPAGLGDEGRLEMRVGVIEHRTGAIFRVADGESALEDVPDLREVVLVEWMMRAGLVAHEPRVRLRRRIAAGMEQHLAPLPGPPQRLPLAVVDVDRGERLVRQGLAHGPVPPLITRCPSGASNMPYPNTLRRR